jgi:hypothetical protein
MDPSVEDLARDMEGIKRSQRRIIGVIEAIGQAMTKDPAERVVDDPEVRVLGVSDRTSIVRVRVGPGYWLRYRLDRVTGEMLNGTVVDDRNVDIFDLVRPT